LNTDVTTISRLGTGDQLLRYRLNDNFAASQQVWLWVRNSADAAVSPSRHFTWPTQRGDRL